MDIACDFCNWIAEEDFCQMLPPYSDRVTQLIPELEEMIGFEQKNPHHSYDVFIHTVQALKNCNSEDLTVRLAVFFHDFGKPHSFQDGENGVRHFKGHAAVSAGLADTIMTRLKFESQLKKNVTELVRFHDSSFVPRKKYIRRWLGKIGETQFRRLLEVRKADIRGQREDYEAGKIEELEVIERLIEEVLSEEENASVKSLKITGGELLAIGYKPGGQIGQVLNDLLESVGAGDTENDREALLKRAAEWL